MNTPTPIRDIPTLFTITYSDGYATKLVDAAEYDRVFSELTAAREELDKWEQIAHDKLSEVCRQIEKTRVVTEQRDAARRLAEKYRNLSCEDQDQADELRMAHEIDQLRGALLAMRDHYRQWSIPGTLYNQVEAALSMSNAGGMARELAAQDSDNTNQLNG